MGSGGRLQAPRRSPGSGAVPPAGRAGRSGRWVGGGARRDRAMPSRDGGGGRSATLLLRVRLPERGLAGLSLNGRLTSHPDAVRRVPGAAGAAALLVFFKL